MMEEDAVIQIDYVDNEDKNNEEEWDSENDIYSEYFYFFICVFSFVCVFLVVAADDWLNDYVTSPKPKPSTKTSNG